jgi:hypothetical protein
MRVNRMTSIGLALRRPVGRFSPSLRTGSPLLCKASPMRGGSNCSLLVLHEQIEYRRVFARRCSAGPGRTMV